MMHLPKNKFKALLKLTKINPLLPVLKMSFKMIKVNNPVKTGTQMIKMIKRKFLASMRISNPVV